MFCCCYIYKENRFRNIWVGERMPRNWLLCHRKVLYCSAPWADWPEASLYCWSGCFHLDTIWAFDLEKLWWYQANNPSGVDPEGKYSDRNSHSPPWILYQAWLAWTKFIYSLIYCRVYVLQILWSIIPSSSVAKPSYFSCSQIIMGLLTITLITLCEINLQRLS